MCMQIPKVIQDLILNGIDVKIKNSGKYGFYFSLNIDAMHNLNIIQLEDNSLNIFVPNTEKTEATLKSICIEVVNLMKKTLDLNDEFYVGTTINPCWITLLCDHDLIRSDAILTKNGRLRYKFNEY